MEGTEETTLMRLSSIIGDEFVPKGIAIDDDERGLVEAIEDYAQEKEKPVKIEPIFSGKSPEEILAKSRGSDFVMVDHRLEDKFEGFQNGLEIVEAIRNENKNIPILYYTGLEDELLSLNQTSRREGSFTKRARAVLDHPRTYFFPKHDLEPEKSLPEFLEIVHWEAFHYAFERISPALKKVIANLLTAQIVRTEDRLFKVVGPEGGGWTRIEEHSTKPGSIDELVPSRLLRKAGIPGRHSYAKHCIIEFSKGQVLSFFSPTQLSEDKISDKVIKKLRKFDARS